MSAECHSIRSNLPASQACHRLVLANGFPCMRATMHESEKAAGPLPRLTAACWVASPTQASEVINGGYLCCHARIFLCEKPEMSGNSDHRQGVSQRPICHLRWAKQTLMPIKHPSQPIPCDTPARSMAWHLIATGVRLIRGSDAPEPVASAEPASPVAYVCCAAKLASRAGAFTTNRAP